MAQTWAYALLGALHYATLWWLRDQPSGPRRLAEQLTELLWSGLRPRE